MIQLCDVVGDVACHEDKEGRLTLSSSIVAYLLHKAGLPMGRKTVTNPGVPYWLTRSERTIRARYLKRVFSDEGEFIGTEGRSAPYGVSMSATYYIPMPRGSNPSRLKAKQRTATRESASRRGSLRGSYRMSLASPSGGTEIAGIRGCHAGRLWHQGKAAPQGDLQEAGWGIIAAFVVTITGLENLRRFRGRIGFANCKKRRSLEDHLRYRRGLRHRTLQR